MRGSPWLVRALLIILIVVIGLYALDHILFPTLPVPAGVAPIMK